MHNYKIKVWILILGFIVFSMAFHLPDMCLSLTARLFIRYKYGISCEWKSLDGGFANGITIRDLKLSSRDHAYLKSPNVFSNIRFSDFIFRKNAPQYHISLEKPAVVIQNPSFLRTAKKSNLRNPGAIQAKTQLFIADGSFVVQDEGQLVILKMDNLSGQINNDGRYLDVSLKSPEHKTLLSGKINLLDHSADFGIINGKIKFPHTELPDITVGGKIVLTQEAVQLDNGLVTLGELPLELNGSIKEKGKLKLEVSPKSLVLQEREEKNRFMIEGSLDSPLISTRWGVVDSVFRIGSAKYNNGKLVFSKIIGNMRLPGFIPLELSGGLVIGPDDIGFNNITVSQMVNIDGTFSRTGSSDLRLQIKGAKGKELAVNLPEALKPFFSSHIINSDVLVYGKMGNLQAGGSLTLSSYPVGMVFRYRHKRLSFSSVRDGPFSMNGSLNFGKTQNIKIRGCFSKMNFADLLALFSDKVAALNPAPKGIIDGEFNITGNLNDPAINAKLEIDEGEIGSIKFDSAYLNLEGEGPILNLKHSVVYYKEVPAELAGFIDPKSKDLFSSINIIPADNSFIWKGLNVEKDTKSKTVVFGQDVDENVSIHFKTPTTSDPVSGDADNKPEVEVKYRLQDNKNILLKMEEDEGTVGVEHKVKF